MKKKLIEGISLDQGKVRKIWKTMRLIVFLFFVSLIHVSASVYSQKTKLNIKLENATLQQVFSAIQEQTEFDFFYKNEQIPANARISIQYQDEAIEVVLEKILKGTGLTYHLMDKDIVISSTSTAKSELLSQQQKTVSGKVTDTTGSSLPGVSVVVKGSTTGIITDADGKYILTNVPANATLQFSFVGMKTQDIVVEGKATINVTLAEDAIGIEEVVAIGYGTTKKATVTGAISSIAGDQLKVSPSMNLSGSLAGRLSGLLAISRSGEPGADGATLRIRGSNTLGDNSPLIVVDGIPNRDLERLNPSDIESATVLKDASAAIYGSQAANGVILITTKRGKSGIPAISVNYNQGWSMPTVLPKMADAATYAQIQNEINGYKNQTPTYTAEDIQKFKDGSDPWGHPNTNWFDAVYKPFSRQNNTNISVSGGSENLKYFVSAGHKFQDGNYRNSATNYAQYDIRTNLDGKISDNINLSIDISARQEDRSYPTRTSGDIFNMAIRSYPTMPAFWPNGLPGPDIEKGDNPAVMATDQTGYQKFKSYVFTSNAKLNVIIPWIKGLSVTGNIAVDKNLNNTKIWQTPWYLYSWDHQTYDENNVPSLIKGSRGYSTPQLYQKFDDGNQLSLNILLNYERTIADKHNIKFLAGSEKITGQSMNFSAFRKFYISTANQELFAGGDLEKDNNGWSGETARLNYFGRINYNFSEKYLLEFVWRYDGSYKFPANDRFGFFPGASLGWRISDEKFWKDNLSFISYFKLRGSWGQTGNDRIEDYQYLSSYGFDHVYILDNSLEVKTLRELRVPNNEVTWEVANQSDIGFDAHMFGEKLTFSADYFYNLRSNILWWRNASVPATTGIVLPRENIGKVANQGFEFEIGYKGNAGKLGYNLSLNGAFQKNKIKFWDEAPGAPSYQVSTGHPMFSRLLYNAIGIFKDQAAIDAYPHWSNARPGDIIFEDVNKDNKIDGLDQVRSDKTELPTLSGGLIIGLTYNKFYANIIFQGSAGAITTHTTQSGLFGNFLTADAEGRWTEDNINADKPRAWNNFEQYWIKSGGNNTYFNMNNDYVRLKNIEIGYNLPDKIISKLKINELRVYFSGVNLLTFTKMVDFDPEASSGSFLYPPLKVYNAGIALTF
jgi:TonB-dependent starch-binding outer membrane protein SusC